MQDDDATNRWTAAALAALLRGGTALAALIGLVGGAKYLFDHGAEAVALHVFHGEPGEYRSVVGIIGRVLDENGRAMVQLGVLALVAVPIARVVLSGIGFARERDSTYVASSVIVLGLLVWSLFGG